MGGDWDRSPQLLSWVTVISLLAEPGSSLGHPAVIFNESEPAGTGGDLSTALLIMPMGRYHLSGNLPVSDSELSLLWSDFSRE